MNNILVDAIIGCGFKSMQQADNYTKRGLATYTGNQWNPDWSWNREALSPLSDDELKDIYSDIADAGEFS